MEKEGNERKYAKSLDKVIIDILYRLKKESWINFTISSDTRKNLFHLYKWNKKTSQRKKLRTVERTPLRQ